MSPVKPTRSSFGVMAVLCAFGLAVAVSAAQQEGRGAETGRGEGGRGGRGRGFPPPIGVAPVPPGENPFAGRSGYKPEIFSPGHRNQQGLAVHPQTGELWSNEQGPNGGDEINIILPGRNYGWPLVSHGRTYAGPRQSEIPWREGMEQPIVVWVPSIAVSGMTFYTGDRFPRWKGNVFVGGLRTGEIPRTGHIERLVFNENGEELRRESLLTELRQRIRDVRQGPDGFLYVLTEEDEAALLKIEPTP